MTEQVSKARQKAKTAESEVDELPSAVETPEIDDLLDEIDSVLEENAELFVSEYRQKGGE